MESKETKSKRLIWEKTKEICLSIGIRSSVHGLPTWSSSNVHWSLKIVWLIFAFASWCYFAYLFYTSLVLYYSFKVSTATSIVTETPTTFPGRTNAPILMATVQAFWTEYLFSGRYLQSQSPEHWCFLRLSFLCREWSTARQWKRFAHAIHR